MTSRGKHDVSRRRLLAGAGAILSLPFLESLTPRRARAAEGRGPTRLLYYYVPNGINGRTRSSFWPAPETAGPNWQLTPMLKSLEPWKARFTFIEGLENVPGTPIGGDHAVGTAAFLTGARAARSETQIRIGISVDQMAAAKIGKLTCFPSMQLGIEGGSNAGGCDSGYSCAYRRNISWSGPSTPLAKLTDPRQAFDQLFAGLDTQATVAEQMRRRAYKKSVLDAALADVQALVPKLSRTDRVKLDEYTDGVRELERRIESVEVSSCAPGAKPATGLDFPAHVKAMTDIMVLAFQCDTTRIVSFMLGNSASDRQHTFLGVRRGHHDVSHHAGNGEALAQLEKIGTWEVEQLAYLLSRLAAVSEGEHDLLHNTTVLWSSEISDGDRHTHADKPVLLAGEGGGMIRTGHYLHFSRARRAKVADLLISTLRTVGDGSTIGDGTGPLEGVLKTS